MSSNTVLALNPDTLIDQHDRAYLVDTLSRLARVPTHVPLGYDTFIEPDHPRLVHYVQVVLRPELIDLGCYDLIDAGRNNMVVRLGAGGTGRALLIQNYTPAQHNNLMDDPFSGKIASARAYGCDEPAVFGQGVSQCKAHQAVMLAALRWLQESGVALNGRLYWAINNEGNSSHACTESVLAALDEQPDFCIIQVGTGLTLSLGNRGRVDVNIHVKGKVTHSSTPDQGLSAIDGANEVLNRLKRIQWHDTHPLLGGRHAIAYKIRYEPVAPHTLPSDAYITVDRRMLPGDDPEAAAQEIREAIGDLSPYEVTVEAGFYMLPALVEPDDPGVQTLQRANERVRGRAADTVYGQGSFDAGGLCVHGIPAVMYGASGGESLVGADFVPVSAVETELKVLIHTILEWLT